MAGIFILLLVVGASWYGRDVASKSAPQDTAAVFHFFPNRLTWGQTIRALGNMTLVSNRSITASDIRSFTKGEFSLFIGNDGSRSVALRSSKELLPTNTLDSLGILVQETSKGIYLLSDRPVARMNWDPNHIWFGSLHWPGEFHIGNAYFLENETIGGPIYASSGETRVRLPRMGLATIQWKKLPENTIFALAMPALPNLTIEGITTSIDALLSSFKPPSSTILAQRLLTFPGSILLTKTESTPGFLLVSSSINFARDLQQNIIQTAAALQAPRLQSFILPDQSPAKEIIVDPSLSTIEEITMGGSLVSRVSILDGEYLYSAESDDSFIVTNKQDLLENQLSDEIDWMKTACNGNIAYLHLRELNLMSSSWLISRTVSPLTMLAEEYSAISVNQGLFHTNIHLCH
ncbi:hypothetical protein A2501_03595 [Candidatus Uhrbacteria bacterium RIFOXYC12_FULL_57_11]|nr:MAG: hypothetical protein A2501_03595 [Candidatus Uhrbacteria bacterium RIFOXYC12_FULL_57_11]